jgi:hypothetical protein
VDAREYTHIRRLDTPPKGHPSASPNAVEALADAFRDLDLGDYDEGTLDWIADHFTDEAARTLVSLVERARNAAILKSWAEAKTYNNGPAVGRAQVPDDLDHDLGDEPIQPWLEGESTFGLPNPYGRHR